MTIDSIIALGYKDCDQTEQITAQMSSITIYRIDGMLFMSSNQPPWQMPVTNVGNLKFTIGKSINSLCKVLTGHVYTDNEQEWLNNYGGNSLFLVMMVSDPQWTSAVVKHWKKGPEGEIKTYDTFTQSKAIVRGLKPQLLPPMLTALTIKLSEPSTPVTIRELQKYTSVSPTQENCFSMLVCSQVRQLAFLVRYQNRTCQHW